MINQQFDVESHNIKSLRFCISAGAPLTLEISQTFFMHTGKVIYQEYGSSETGTIAIYLSDDVELNVKSVGCVIKNVELRILNQEDEDSGSIEIQSEGCSIGYMGSDCFPAGWFSTGDLGRVEENGYLFVVGRKKRLINIAGMKVDAAEIETVLMTHPKIADALVRGIKNADACDGIEALIVRREVELSKDEIKIFCSRQLAGYKVPRVINWIESIPKTELGKTMYWQILKYIYRGNEL